MEPITMGLLAVQGVSALGSLVTGIIAAKDAGKINEQTYQRLMDTADQYQKELDGVLPPGTINPITLEQFKAEVQKFDPKLAEYTPEATPQQITEAGVSGERQAQKQALQQYGRLAQAGYDPIAAAQQESALTAGAAQASAARQAALREASQRGMASTGLDVLSSMGAAEQAGVEGRQAALQAQAEAGQRRLQALGQYGNLAGQMRQQGTQTEQANVGIMNAFNERMARNLNQYNQYVAELQNQAQMFNLQNQQRRDEMNVGLRNQQTMLNWQAEREASEARRAARERNITTAAGIRSGIGGQQATMAGQKLYQDYAPFEQAFSTIGSMAGRGLETGLRSYYGQDTTKKPKYETKE